MSSPGVDENHHISHSGDTNLHCFRFGFLGAKIRGNLVQGESESPDDFPRRLFSSPCPRGAVESLALTPQAAPLCCLPEHSLYTITVTYCHLLAKSLRLIFRAKAEKFSSHHQPGLVRISSCPCGC